MLRLQSLPVWLRPFAPFLLWLPSVSRTTLRADAMAGITGAMIVLPQGVAFATIAGLPPQYGLYAAMVPAIIAALLGSSWHLVSGPTTAISIAVYAALHDLAEPGSVEYVRLALTLTFLVGLYQLVLGLARMGTLVNFISHTVVLGFTAGAAALIAASQLKSFFGIPIPRGTPFFEILHQMFVQIVNLNPYVTVVGVVTLVSGLLAKRYVPKFPYMIAAMIVGSVIAFLINLIFGGEAVTGIKTVGALPAGLPPLSLPDFSFAALQETARPALIITLLALTEAVSISRAIATRSEQRIDGNQEFVGQGLSNLVGSFFSAYASSGSFNRSGVNYEAGARTPVASVIAAVALVIILLLVAPLAAYLPNAAMAGILFLVAWGLIDFHHIKSVWQTSKPESAILWVTLIGTLINLEEGIFLGVLLSLIMYLYRSSKPTVEPVVPAGGVGSYHFENAKGKPECPQVRFVRIHGSLYFGAVDHIQRALQQIDEDNPQQKTVCINAAGISFVDVAGAEMLAQEARRRRRMGGGLYFYRLREPVYKFLRQGEYLKHIGEGGFFPVRSNVAGAIYWTLNPEVCRTCKTRIFRECHGDTLPNGHRRVRLMFASDGSEFSDAPRAVAVSLAKQMGVTLDAMTMVSPDADNSVLEQRLLPVKEESKRVGIHCECVIRRGTDPTKEVPAAVSENDSHMLIIGRRPPEGLVNRMVGANAATIIAESHSHVLVVPKNGRYWQKGILVGFDANPSANSALEIATTLAKAANIPVTLLAVTKEGDRAIPVLQELLDEAVEMMRLEGVEAEGRIEYGPPAEVILGVARNLGADLLVIGQRASGLNLLLPNSVTDHLIGSEELPILIAKSLK